MVNLHSTCQTTKFQCLEIMSEKVTKHYSVSSEANLRI